MKGQCKWFSTEKGHGFITGEDGTDYFAHYSEMLGEGRKNLNQYQEVEFRPDQNAKGPRAREIKPL